MEFIHLIEEDFHLILINRIYAANHYGMMGEPLCELVPFVHVSDIEALGARCFL